MAIIIYASALIDACNKSVAFVGPNDTRNPYQFSVITFQQLNAALKIQSVVSFKVITRTLGSS